MVPSPAVRLARFAALALTLLVAGCGGKGAGSVTGPGGPSLGTVSDLRKLITNAYVTGVVIPTNADTSASLLATMDVNGIRAAAALYLNTGSLVDAGTVTVRTHNGGIALDETALDKESINVQGFLQYVYTSLASHPLGINLTFDGSEYHRFANTGAGAFAAFTDSVQSVQLPVVSAPTIGATASRSVDLAVTWSNAGTDSSVYLICSVTSHLDSTAVAIGTLARDTDGATVVPTARLQHLPAGSARFALARYRLVYHTDAGQKVGIACETVSTRDITLN